MTRISTELVYDDVSSKPLMTATHRSVVKDLKMSSMCIYSVFLRYPEALASKLPENLEVLYCPIERYYDINNLLYGVTYHTVEKHKFTLVYYFACVIVPSVVLYPNTIF